MRTLTVLYDASCGFCCSCRGFLEAQRQLVTLEFVPAGSPEARRRFPSLATAGPPDELVVVSDAGDVYRGSHAWIVCLWATDDFREWSFRLAHPALRPLARNVFECVSHRRKALSRLLRLAPDHQVAAALSSGRAPCASARCDVAPLAKQAR